jgi:hypothetical protein
MQRCQLDTARNFWYVGQSSPKWTKVQSTAPWPKCFKSEPNRSSSNGLATRQSCSAVPSTRRTLDAAKSEKWAWHLPYTNQNLCWCVDLTVRKLLRMYAKVHQSRSKCRSCPTGIGTSNPNRIGSQLFDLLLLEVGHLLWMSVPA